MEKNEYTILKRVIPNVNLHSLTDQYWFDTEINDWEPWVSGSNPPVRIPGLTPITGSIVHDIRWYPDIIYSGSEVIFYSGKTYSSLITGSNLNNIPSVSSSYWEVVDQTKINTTKGKYYKWNGNQWNLITGTSEQINQQLYPNYNLPIFLEAKADEMGVMVSFDGYMEQVDQLCNFSYTQTGSTVTVYNTVNPDKLRKIIEQNYTIDWGDGTTGSLAVNSGVLYSNLPSVSHTYTGTTNYTITVSLLSPWTTQKVSKIVTIPQNISVPNPMGTFTGMTIPAYSNLTGQTQNYLNTLDYTNNTGNTIFRYMALGGSKIGELKKYGETTVSSSLYTTGSYSGSLYTGYTLPSDSGSLYYMDLVDGYTMITGTTSAFTKEEVFNNVITRNEHFIGFIDDPTIYSDIFVERGRQGIMEPNLRLGEIDNMSELDVYGNGYFNIKKQ